VTNSLLSHTTYARASRYWNLWKSRSRSPARDAPPDAFAFEAWLPEASPPISFTLTILQTRADSQAFFQKGVTINEGYNCILVPRSEIEAQVKLYDPYLIQIEPVGDASGREVVFGLLDFVCLKRQPSIAAPKVTPVGEPSNNNEGRRLAKCVVWDLDNTVWTGTLAEDGKECLRLRAEVAAAMIELDRRGILQSVASKNDREPALAALEAFGLKQYLLYPEIGWGPKSNALRRIAEQLDIGLDSLVFVDDEAFERGEVGAAHPMVTLIPSENVDRLLNDPLFDVPATAEGSRRRRMYQVEELRQTAFADADTDYVAFLRGCKIRLTIRAISGSDLERAYELSQRTNQLNFSGTKLSRADISNLLLRSTRHSTYLLKCEDRFGDYGIIGMCVVDMSLGRVNSFMMSCRVQRKRLEMAFFSWLARRLSRDHATIEVAYRKTSKNVASTRMLEELGFEYRPSRGADEGSYVRSTADAFLDDDVVYIQDYSESEADGA